MIGDKPDFMDSPFFVGEADNWHLKPGAPKHVQDEFNAYMQFTSQAESPKKLPPVVFPE